MAKKPMRISEILAKRSVGVVQNHPSSDFIAESQMLINQYSQGINRTDDAVVTTRTPLAGVTTSVPPEPVPTASAPSQELAVSTPQTSESALQNVISKQPVVDSNPQSSASASSLKAPGASPSNDQVTPAPTITEIKAEPLNASIAKRNNSVTIAKQLRNNSVTDSVTIAKQLRNDYGTITEQLRNDSVTKRNSSVTIPEQLRNDSVTDSVTHSVTITEQLRNNSVTTTITPPHVNRLAGNKLTIIETIFEFCQARGSTNSGPISRDIFETKTRIEGEVIRVTCHRLMKEGYLKVLESKRGNGGFTIYELHPVTHSQLVSGYFRNNSVTIPKQLRNNSVTESVTESVTNPPSKIDSKNNINLTNLTQQPELQWFKELDFTKVAPIGPMQVNSTIRTLIQEKLDPEGVQNFIHRFTSWMATQTKISNPVGMFCEKLKEYAHEGDSPVLYAMTDEERQIEAEFAAQVEKARAEMALIQKAREQSDLKAKEEQFERWYQQASEDEMIQLFKPTAVAKLGSPSYKLGLKAVYLEHSSTSST